MKSVKIFFRLSQSYDNCGEKTEWVIITRVNCTIYTHFLDYILLTMCRLNSCLYNNTLVSYFKQMFNTL